MNASRQRTSTPALGLVPGSGRSAVATTGERSHWEKVLPALLQVAMLLCIGVDLPAQEIMVPRLAEWRYSDVGVAPGVGWQAISFDDATWKSGPGILGYGDGDVATVISYGSASTNKFITTYFRHSFVASNAAAFDRLQVQLLRDDGAVVYLNGTEILRNNLPAGPITNTTRALTAVGGAEERSYFEFTVGAERLAEGTNVLAVEIHQSSPTSSDVAFDLAMNAEWTPFVITPLVTGDNIGGTNGSIELAVSVTDPTLLASNVTVRFHLRAAGPSAGPDFTIGVLPDTQYYAASLNGGNPGIFNAQVDWIVTNRVARIVAFVTHLGDVVEHGDNGGTNTEWLAAANALYRLEDPLTTSLADGIPYGIAVGNHDQTPSGSAQGSTQFYNQYFGTNRFASRSYYGGHFGTNNDNHYELFDNGALGFVILHLEYNAETNSAVLEWAGQVLRTHADRRAIFVGHTLINPGQPGAFNPAGQTIYDALKGHTNLFLMLCGHAVGEGRRADIFEERTVHTLLADYQGRANGGNGWLRLLEFSPSNSVIRVRTYSPLLDQYETDADSEFTLGYDMSLGGPFAWVGEISSAVPAAAGHVTCFNLASATTYEWFVSVADGLRVQASPVWRFTTGDVGESNQPPTLAIRAVDTFASEVGPYPGRFVVTRSGRSDTELPVNFEITGSASNSVDFARLENSVVIATGTNSAVVTLVPHADGVAEGFEVVTVTLMPGEAYEIGSNMTATIWIADDESDSDQDGHSDGAEALAGTDPMDPQSVLKLSIRVTVTGEAEFTWPGATGRVYRVCFKDNLEDSEWTDLSEDFEATSEIMHWLAPMPAVIPHRFYAVRVADHVSVWKEQGTASAPGRSTNNLNRGNIIK